ncbi:MAG: pectate lyase [Cyclobacteriaceae bacterium]|nr:pectate lyase [Cyclobacteriaceae bacterium]
MRCGDDPQSPVDNDPPDDKPIPVVETAYAFPGAEGFGRNATGGRGGRVIKVTNLNDAGTGSLRAAIGASGARIIVFEVAGTIELQSNLNITQPDLTIAGQTAAGDGITLKNYPLFVGADNVIIRFIRFRLGNEKQVEGDAIWGRYRKNVIIDHCSMSWCTDEAASFYANQDFTLQWCIISESLNNSLHEKGSHGYGGIWGGDRASFHHNLIAHHKSRNPRFNGWRPGVSNGPYLNEQVDYRNNVIYNWVDESAYGGENGKYNIVNNFYKSGPATPASKVARIMRVSKESSAAYAPGYGQFYITGNYVVGNSTVTGSNWSGVIYDGGTTQAQAQLTSAIEFEITTSHTAEQAYSTVLDFAGASLKRDAVDLRVVDEVRNGTFTYRGSVTDLPGIIDSQEDVGGWPVLQSIEPMPDSDGDGMPDAWEVEMKLDPAKANASEKELSTGYTNIEVYINSLVKTIMQLQK